ncbi:MAG TPA: HTH domain-containing protein, partial [Chloroflexota bacterium]|nr:HTH domain-containing protein [Chloroflexota bacterium]
MDEIDWEDDEGHGREEATKRLARILQIISLIQNGPRRWTRGRLVEHLGYSTRQIDKDLQLIRNGLHYELEHTRQGYYFTRAPELHAIQYTPAEALALLGALQLARSSGALDTGSLAAALARTEEALPGAYLDLAQTLRRALPAPTDRQRHRAEM